MHKQKLHGWAASNFAKLTIRAGPEIMDVHLLTRLPFKIKQGCPDLRTTKGKTCLRAEWPASQQGWPFRQPASGVIEIDDRIPLFTEVENRIPFFVKIKNWNR